MLIMTLAVVAIAAVLPRGTPGPVVDLAAAQLADGFRQARMRAVSRGAVVSVAIDAAGRRYRVGRQAAATLPDGVRVALPGPPIVRFFPDGGADPAVVRLAAGNQARRLDVSPLTGRVAVR